MTKGTYYKPADDIDELLGRYYDDPEGGLFEDVDTLLVGNHVLISKKDAKEFINTLFRLGYIITDVYIYSVLEDDIEELCSIEPNFETDTEYYYPPKQMIFDLIDSDLGEKSNYVEVVAGTVTTRY